MQGTVVRESSLLWQAGGGRGLLVCKYWCPVYWIPEFGFGEGANRLDLRFFYDSMNKLAFGVVLAMGFRCAGRFERSPPPRCFQNESPNCIFFAPQASWRVFLLASGPRLFNFRRTSAAGRFHHSRRYNGEPRG